jgi:hypothetical protein
VRRVRSGERKPRNLLGNFSTAECGCLRWEVRKARNSAGLAILLVRGIAEQRGGYAVSQKIVPIRHKPRKLHLISESIIVHFDHQTGYFCTQNA